MKNFYKISKKSILIMALLISFSSVFAQRGTNVQKLQELSEQFKLKWEQDNREARNFANRNGIPFRFETDEGILFELQSIKDGKPMYYMTENANSAASISTNNLLPGGSSGLDLDGTGITVHEWDGGAVLGTHQEYAGRVVMGDGVTSTHYHSTHVAGTMIASGVVSSAKGMAPNANLRAFDWNSDESEMASEAAAGALFSNHSYGYGRGWVWTGTNWSWYGNTSISTQEDYLFGFYESQAKDWDGIAYDAPYYLIVKSAGNDRGDGPTNANPPKDGPYDCISHAGIAKNVLTVGAIEDIPGGYTVASDVVMSDFSSWGPADDGRIKPDIVTNGVGLYSSYNTNNTSYASLSGTSMAAPSATGSLVLLQQHYQNLKGTENFMRAATLKALVIETADEAGPNNGPDYMFGWGLMNTEKAALKISENQTVNVIDELVLSNGDSYTRTVHSNGIDPIKVTICWTELPGTPVSASLDPIDPMLVNDLDLRLTLGASTFYSWKLDRDNPANAATNNSENNVDNVEVVYIASPIAGDYTVTIDHDGTLSGGSQAFSIIYDGITENVVPVKPVANFNANNTSIFIGETVNFTDISTENPTTWAWTFPGGTTANNTVQNPEVVYNTAGNYDVSLIASNSVGSDTETKTSYITVSVHPPVANFNSDITTVLINESVSFTDLSTYDPTSWLWTFEGGSPATSTEQNQTVIYNTLGTYEVSLTVTNAGGSDTLTVTGYVTVSDGSIYYCDSYGDDSYEWIESIVLNGITNNSGRDGGYKDYTYLQPFELEANTSYSFTLTPGFSGRSSHQYWAIWIDYNINGVFESDELVYSPSKSKSAVSGSFTTSNSSGITRMRISMSDSGTPSSCGTVDGGEVEDYSVQIGDPGPQAPVADFIADLTAIVEGGTVSFTDLSTSAPTGWVWTFGDGQTSTVQNPSVTYNLADTYDVSLTATNAVGSGTETKTAYVTVTVAVTDPPVANFSADKISVYEGETIQFTDLSTNDPTSWAWDFGDGQTSSLQHPTISYSAAGTYTVGLTVDNGIDSDILTITDYINVSAPPISPYCVPTSINNSADWIDIVTIGGITNSSGKNTNAYTIYTDPIFNLSAGVTYSIILDPYIPKNRNFWRIWIDINGDGDFIDIGETLFTGNNKKGTVSGNITIPSNIVASTRLRITMKTGSSPASCDDNFNGEVEDYTVNITGTNNKSASIQTSVSIDKESEVSFNAYPNPTSDKLYIHIEGWKGVKEIRLLDMTGRTIYLKTISENIFEIDVSTYPKGIYLIDVNNGIHRDNKKIRIQ